MVSIFCIIFFTDDENDTEVAGFFQNRSEAGSPADTSPCSPEYSPLKSPSSPEVLGDVSVDSADVILMAQKRKSDPAQCEILDFKTFVNETNWDVNVKGKKPNWSDVKEVRIEATRPNVVQYKTVLSAEYDEVILYTSDQSTSKRRRKIKPFVFVSDLPPAYNQKLPIGHAKYNDLMALCKAGIIPKVHHDFFENLAYVGHDPEESEDDCLLDEFYID